ncbi:hypothetical protein TRSC58_05358 [Trypanosoma rangeli SC58]|uniref:U3 small nucleolar RNA-associated protein 25 n=1 Tax=Trypanosoma rangeli SC58 TaxID=429131 RepID=A0A061IY07_TRYRA|nr:hypothetical protein TRSC58_05358 [Trypanosoma rangeli SC58]
MGKAGGFFKRLKAKQKRSASRRRRGTKGASKEERRAKHNERVDYYAAKREAEALAAISSSEGDNDAVSTDSETEARRQEQSLLRLRRLIGAAAADSGTKRRRGDNGIGGESDGNAQEGGDRDATAVAEQLSEGEDWRAYLPEEEEEEEEEEDVLLDEMSDDDDDYDDEGGDYEEMEEGEEENGDDEEEEDVGKEDEYEDDDSVVAGSDGDDDAATAGEMQWKQRMEETVQLLPQFRPGTTGAAALRHVVVPNDPWFVKYHQDKHGGIDTTPMQFQGSQYHRRSHPGDGKKGEDGNVADIAVAASAHAVRHFLHAPFVLGKHHPERPPYMHEMLWTKWLEYCAAESRGPMTVEERGLLDLLQGYPDVMDCCRSWENADARREIYLLHALNHWFKARSVVLAHDALLQERRRRHKQRQGRRRTDGGKKNSEEAKEQEDEEEYEFRDRGFGRTRIIIMLPMRNIAHRYMTTLVKLLRASSEDCAKLSMFNEDFTELAEAADPTFKRRPRDYQRQFAGNIDDTFCVGVRLEPSRVRVYAHPLNSDVILCSPLGLRRRLERSGDVLVSLASIEVCILDEAHVLLMQNWQHVSEVLRLLNKRPKDTTHGLSDLRRVYAWALSGHSGRHRQTIMSSNLTNATLLATFRLGVNNSGRVLLQHREEAGVLAQVMVPVRQHFLRFDPGPALETCDDARFDFFTREVYVTKISPLVERDVRTIVFVPSYFDFVRLRNYLIREHRDSFAAICEYTSLPQQRKALGQFTDLERPLLLVTERFYFFKRYFVKLAEVMVFYSPPLFPAFYASLVGRLVATSPNAFALTLFCRFDTHELQRLVGTRRMRQLLEREADAFSFVTN